VSKVAVYARTDSTTPVRAVLVALNRLTSSQVAAISGLLLSGTASVYQIRAASAQGQSPAKPALVQQFAVSASRMNIRLPGLSVATIEVK
jgi:hypothetical protein